MANVEQRSERDTKAAKRARGQSRRTILSLAAVGGGATVAGAAFALTGPATTAAQPASTMVGAWTVVFTGTPQPPQPAFSATGILVATSDGIIILDGAPRNPGPVDNQEYETAAYGSWQSTSERSTAFTVLSIAYDDDGDFGGTERRAGTIDLDDTGDTFTGNLQVTIMDRRGNAVASWTNTMQGRRIRAEGE